MGIAKHLANLSSDVKIDKQLSLIQTPFVWRGLWKVTLNPSRRWQLQWPQNIPLR